MSTFVIMLTANSDKCTYYVSQSIFCLFNPQVSSSEAKLKCGVGDGSGGGKGRDG